MQYKYGVEYVNTTKPDLPCDTLVQWKPTNGRGNEWFTATVGELSWSKVVPGQKTFKIIDERYKPKSEDSSWFERGELPPVGTICECFDFGACGFVKVKVLDASSERERAVVSLQGGTYVRLFWGSKFRPTRTEREKFIEAAMSVGGLRGRDGAKEVYGSLFDAGFKAPEQQ